MTGTRALQLQDGAEVLAINLGGRPGVAPLDHQELSRLLGLPNVHLVATRDRDVVGYLLAFHRDAPYDGEEFLAFRQILTEPYLYVDQVAVGCALRHQGVGRCLYAGLVSVAVRQGIGLLCCEVNITPPNERSLAFHEKLGFSAVTRWSTRDARQVQLMAWTLAPGRASAPVMRPGEATRGTHLL